MYRRKFKQAKDKIIKNNIDKDNKLFFDDSVLNKKWFDPCKYLTDLRLIIFFNQLRLDKAVSINKIMKKLVVTHIRIPPQI